VSPSQLLDRVQVNDSRRDLAGGAAGFAVCVAVGTISYGLGKLTPTIGAPAIAIVLGMVLSVAAGRRFPVLGGGAAFASRQLLQASVVLLGAELSMRDVFRTGLASLPVMLGTLSLALLGARVFGRLLHVEGDLRTLIGVGTGICGASAIAAVSRIIAAGEAEVAYSMSTIFAFNVLAVVTFPALGHVMGLSQHTFGLWSGTAINDTSSVVAATATYGHAASSYGVVVKLTRALMIVPISGWLAVRMLKRARKVGIADDLPTPHWWTLVPWFIGYFLLATLANTVGAVPQSWHLFLSDAATFLITVALVGVGLLARVADMRRSGLRALGLGACLWATVGVSSLVLQAIFHKNS
jgi:uncharacterized integral membrane protein (TIGR00698 family)